MIHLPTNIYTLKKKLLIVLSIFSVLSSNAQITVIAETASLGLDKVIDLL